MLRVVIADDEPLGRERLRTLLAAESGVSLVGEYGDGDAAMEGIVQLAPDAVFLDVHMPGTDGVTVARRLREANSANWLPVVVFVTAYGAHALEAFEIGATDYLLKPFDRHRFRDALARTRERVIGRSHAPVRFVVRTGARLTLVDAADVEWIGGDGNYARLHAGGRQHLVRETLKSVEQRLDPARFVRIHRSAIISLDHVVSMRPHSHGQYLVRMADGTQLTSSRTHTARLRSLLQQRG